MPSLKINSVNRKDIPLLCIAAVSGSFDVTKILLKAGANVEAADVLLIILMFFILSFSFYYNLWSFIVFITTAIHWAAITGHHQVLQLLLDNGGKAILQHDSSPLLLATRYGRFECANLLIKSGCDVNKTDAVYPYLMQFYYFKWSYF